MKLYLVRHTSAADYAASDGERALTPQGEAEARVTGAALARLRVQPTRVASSPLLRARQTAGIIAQETKFAGKPDTMAVLDNGSSTTSLLWELKSSRAKGDVILVGHMPSLADHVATMAGLPSSAELEFGKGSVACLELDRLQAGKAKLCWVKHLAELQST